MNRSFRHRYAAAALALAGFAFLAIALAALHHGRAVLACAL